MLMEHKEAVLVEHHMVGVLVTLIIMVAKLTGIILAGKGLVDL